MNLKIKPNYNPEQSGNGKFTFAAICRMAVLVVLTALWLSVGQALCQSGDNQADKQDKKTDESKVAKTGEDQTTSGQSTAADPNKDKTGKPKKVRRGEIVAAPIPISSPAIGGGLVAVGAYVFPFNKEDKVSPPSTVGVAAMFTSNGSRAFGMGGKFYLKEDKYRLTAAAFTGDINVELFGVGKIAGDRGTSLPFNFKGGGLFVEPLFRVRKSVYVGFRFQFRRLSSTLNREKAGLPDTDPRVIEIVKEIFGATPADLLRTRTVSLGPQFEWDTRDNTFSPTRGVLMEGNIDIFATGLGSKFSYQYYKLAFNKYTNLRDRHVLAYRATVCAAGGERVPVYDLCIFGASNDLRGYTAGRYIDRRMFATQAEYRLSLPGTSLLSRFGFVAFGGFGGVGRSFSDIGVSDFLPGGGAGLRFRLSKKYPINFRVDYGIGRDGHTVTIGIAEAF